VVSYPWIPTRTRTHLVLIQIFPYVGNTGSCNSKDASVHMGGTKQHRILALGVCSTSKTNSCLDVTLCHIWPVYVSLSRNTRVNIFIIWGIQPGGDAKVVISYLAQTHRP